MVADLLANFPHHHSSAAGGNDLSAKPTPPILYHCVVWTGHEPHTVVQMEAAAEDWQARFAEEALSSAPYKV
jgi:hypothetical protein